MADSVTYREKRRKDSVKKFLNGEARRPYILREDISCGLRDQAINGFCEESENINSSSCVCQETLGKFADSFKSMLHTGPKLFNRASIQQPKTANKKYRDINQQNKWLLNNVFDSYGNYIFCFSCIKNILDVGGKRLHRLRGIKRQQASVPTIRIRKDQVSTEQTCNVVPPDTVTNVLSWWASLENNSIIELHNPPKLHHGKSNYSKEDLLTRFLEFIDNNSQPNGRRVGSHGPLFFLNSKFDRINAPSASEAGKPDQWKRRSLVYEYVRTLEDNKSISNGTAKKWLRMYRPKHAICPKKTDYCEMCVECQEQKRRHETISMRLQQEGNGNEDEIRENKALSESYGLLLEEHKMDAANELDHYRHQTSKSRSLYNHLEELRKRESKSKEEKVQLQELTGQITFTLSLDYQQSKLTPHWGFSAQPSETYYLRKLSHNIFGIVDHTLAKNAVYVLDERAGGAKNADITISSIDHYIHQQIPSWARHLCLFMDNGATNKNQFMIQWAMELIERNDYDTIRMCFFVPGHGKNDADRLFSRISHAFHNNDVFVTEHLLKLIRDTLGPSDRCIHATSRDIVNWKGLLAQKYTSLKEITSYRDFLIERNATGRVVVYHKECCYAGKYAHKELLKRNVDAGLDLMGEVKNFTYEAKGMSPDLSKKKMADLVKMYDKFIDPILRPKWLPASYTTTTPIVTTSTPSSELAREHRAALKKRNKGKKESKQSAHKVTFQNGRFTFVLEEGLTISGKPLKDHEEVVGHARAIDLVYDFIRRKSDLTEKDLFDLHKAIQSERIINVYKPVGAWKVEPNSTVIVSGDTQVIFEFAAPEDVPELMQSWITLFQKTCKEIATNKEAALSAYAYLHISFVRIHPFWDGNGRMARLIANVPVIMAGYPPVIIPREHRQEYIESLSEYHLAVGTVTSRHELLPDVDKLDRFKRFCAESWSESSKLVDNARKQQQKRNQLCFLLG